MEGGIQYATASDGVRIAFAASGSGPALVHMPNLGISMFELERRSPERARWTDLLSERFTLVRYDTRGTGYSQRDVDDTSVQAHLLDLEAVVSRMEFESFALFGFLWSAYIAPYYAAKHPDRVSRLILWPADTRRFSSEEYRTLGELALSDWETFTETYAHLAVGWDKGDPAHRYAQVMQESVSQQMFVRQVAESRTPMSDLYAVAARVRTPTLVLQRKMKFAGDRVARLVAALPDARLQIFEGESTVPYLGDVRSVVGVIERFAGTGRVAAHSGEPATGRIRPEAHDEANTHLTEREQDIVRLVAAGRSNQEIADELVVSVRTVERHLYNVYNKLGVSGKSARAAAAVYGSGKGRP